MSDEFVAIPLDQIIGPKEPLQIVDKSTSEYFFLKESLAAGTQIHNILVRPAGERAPGKYEVICGNTRYEAYCDLGFPTIWCRIIECDDFEALRLQLEENASVKPTSDADYRRRIVRFTQLRPNISVADLAVLIHRPRQWVSKQLHVLSLDKETLKLVDRGAIPANSAYYLAKIHPRSLRTPELIEQAMTLPTKEFALIAQAIIKRHMEEVRQGKLDIEFTDVPFEPQPHMRNIAEIRREYQTLEFAATELTKVNAKTMLDAWRAALKWADHLDPSSIEDQRNKATAAIKQNLRELYQEGKHGDIDD
jgi:ParB-like chromosome segregation protein Spo0J